MCRYILVMVYIIQVEFEQFVRRLAQALSGETKIVKF